MTTLNSFLDINSLNPISKNGIIGRLYLNKSLCETNIVVAKNTPTIKLNRISFFLTS